MATFLTHLLATCWSGFQLASTNSFHSDFSKTITHGACGVNLLPVYWTSRAKFEIPTVAMNALALVISSILSWKLMKASDRCCTWAYNLQLTEYYQSFGWQTFKRIGASLTMSRAYRSILIFSIVIQLSVFFVVVTVALWVDQIWHGDIASLTSRATAFKAVDM